MKREHNFGLKNDEVNKLQQQYQEAMRSLTQSAYPTCGCNHFAGIYLMTNDKSIVCNNCLYQQKVKGNETNKALSQLLRNQPLSMLLNLNPVTSIRKLQSQIKQTVKSFINSLQALEEQSIQKLRKTFGHNEPTLVSLAIVEEHTDILSKLAGSTKNQQKIALLNELNQVCEKYIKQLKEVYSRDYNKMVSSLTTDFQNRRNRVKNSLTRLQYFIRLEPSDQKITAFPYETDPHLQLKIMKTLFDQKNDQQFTKFLNSSLTASRDTIPFLLSQPCKFQVVKNQSSKLVSSTLGFSFYQFYVLEQILRRKDMSMPSFEVIFNSAVNGFKVAQFHRLCDNKPNVLVLVRSTTNGKLFGGFSNTCYSSIRNYKDATKAFLFSVTHKLILQKSNSNAIYDNSSYGPTFGSGHDLYIAEDCNNNINSYSNTPSSYKLPDEDIFGQKRTTISNNQILAGAYNFTVANYIVLKLK